MDPRHVHRIKIAQNLYAFSFKLKKSLPYPQEKKTLEVLKRVDDIDAFIKRYAPKYPIEQIAKTDLAILRLSVFDLIYEKKVPEKVIVDEAVILAKELSGERSYAFINAVLGKILLNLHEKSI